MKIARNLSIVLVLFISFIHLISNTGCANIIPPNGGPRDSLPPKLVSVSPRDSAINFNSKTIVINFDEYVDLDNPLQNVMISPAPKSNPLIDRKLRTVTIKLKDTLKPNTTYLFDFGKAIKDVNEGNVLKNFRYVFSTGPYIDSLELSGRVLLAETGKKDSTLIVMLHKNLDDSAVVNDRPRYVTRVDTGGRFTFRYLAPGTYNVFALKDESGTRKYLSKSELFAFYNKPIVIQQSNEPITLYAYAEKEEPKKPAASQTSGQSKKEEKEKRLIVQTSLSNGELDLLGTLDLQFQTRLKTFDSTKIHLKNATYTDSFKYRLIRDTSNKKFTIAAKWVPDSPYRLILEKDFGEDSLGRKLLRADTIKIHARKESDYGEIRLRFKNLDISKHPVLLFIQSDKVKLSYPLTTSDFHKTLFPPGDYLLRILYDDNQNGVWDPGDFFGKHIQPEKVFPIFIPQKHKKAELTIKASWENDYDIRL